VPISFSRKPRPSSRCPQETLQADELRRKSKLAANEAREDGELIASTGVRERWTRARSIAAIQCSIGTIVITDANGQALTSRRPLAAICRAPRQWLVSAFHRPTGAGHGQAYEENLGEAEHQPHYSELEKMGERARPRQGEMAGAAGVANSWPLSSSPRRRRCTQSTLTRPPCQFLWRRR
jgi:hypothetical protein